MANNAIYPGSFNPFHIGHLNILQKAEAIFDRVIVAYGQDPSKDYSKRVIPKLLNDKEVIFFRSSLVELIRTRDNPVLIRGIRNSADLDYETKQFYWLRQIKPDIKVVFIPSDPEFSHISSSDIRKCGPFWDLDRLAKKYIVK